MRLHRNNDPQPKQQQVCETILATVEEFRVRCDVQGVTIETDLSDCTATGDAAFVKSAASGLIANALCAMPAGGELSLTLVESAHQWELEVADSGLNPSRLSTPSDANESLPPASITRDDVELSLPHIVEFPTTEVLRDVIRLATQNRATIESFSCPLGGTAWVMAVSKYRADSRPDKRAA
jgi:hypothetical protein